MTELNESDFPVLYAHGTRKDWGTGVLSGERDGKRMYLFEGGEERVMGGGAYDMMRKVSPLTSEHQATLARLTALVARRRGLPDPSKAAGFVLAQQLTDLRHAFPQGLADGAWQNENRAARVRSTLVVEAQQALSLKTLDAQLKGQQTDRLWSAVVALLRGTKWVPADQLTPIPGHGVALLAAATRELLYGSASLEQRFDRFVAAYDTAVRRAPRWETVTAVLALVFPAEYVLVDITSFRKQLKALGSKGSLPARPTGATYTRCVSVANIISARLTEGGETVQDLLDVHDFMRFTLKAQAPKRRVAAPKNAKAKKKGAAASGADDAEETSEAADDGD
jgi:hypothetical protein